MDQDDTQTDPVVLTAAEYNALRAEVERLRGHIDRAVAHMDKGEEHAAYAEIRLAQAPPFWGPSDRE